MRNEYIIILEVWVNGTLTEVIYDVAEFNFSWLQDGPNIIVFTLPKDHVSNTVLDSDIPPVVNARIIPPYTLEDVDREYDFTGLVTRRLFNISRQTFVYTVHSPEYILQNTYIAYPSESWLVTRYRNQRVGAIIENLVDQNCRLTDATAANGRYADYEYYTINTVEDIDLVGDIIDIDCGQQNLYATIQNILGPTDYKLELTFNGSGLTNKWDLDIVDDISNDATPDTDTIPRLYLADLDAILSDYNYDTLDKKHTIFVSDIDRNNVEVYTTFDQGTAASNELFVTANEDYDQVTFQNVAKSYEQQNLRKYRQTFQVRPSIYKTYAVHNNDLITTNSNTRVVVPGTYIQMITDGREDLAFVWGMNISYSVGSTIVNIITDYGYQ